jgi:hypothetical protein
MAGDKGDKESEGVKLNKRIHATLSDAGGMRGMYKRSPRGTAGLAIRLIYESSEQMTTDGISDRA